MKIKHLTLLIMLLCAIGSLPKLASAQAPSWVKPVTGDSSQCAREIQVDDFGNVYTLGQFRGTVDLDPGSAVQMASSLGDEDIYLQKLDPNGDLLWALNFGGLSLQDGTGMAIDNTGNIFLTGGFDETVDFDPGSGTDIHVSAGDADVFLVKIDPNGQFQWVKTIGGQLNDFAEGIDIDQWGNIHLIGNFEGTVDFDPGSGISFQTAADSHDIFLAKFTPAGNFIWAGSCPGNRDVNFVRYEIASDDSGNVYAAGGFIGTTDFDPGPGIDIHTNQGFNDIFLLKLDSSGQYQWAQTYGSTGEDVAFAIGIDANQQVNFAGGFSETIDFGGPSFTLQSAGDADAFVGQLSPAGTMSWIHGFGGEGFDYTTSISVELPGEVLICGQFVDSIILPNTTLISQGDQDAFVLRGSSSGQYETAASFGGTDETTAEDITVDNAGLLYIAGSFSGSTDFDFSGSGTPLNSTGELDAYTLKINVIVSLEEALDLEPLFYPNPTQGQLRIELEKFVDPGEWSLYDLQGQLKALGQFDQSTFEIGLSEFPRGMYLLQLKAGGRSHTEKIMRY